MTGEAMTIGQLAASADVHVETVRYYQRRGLLPEPSRPAGGIRRYGPGEVGRLQFIRRAQRMGFSLEEVAGLLAVSGQHACEQTRQLTELKLEDVRRRLFELKQLEHDLLALVADCAQVGSGDGCPTLERLEHASSAALLVRIPGDHGSVSPRRQPTSGDVQRKPRKLANQQPNG